MRQPILFYKAGDGEAFEYAQKMQTFNAQLRIKSMNMADKVQLVTTDNKVHQGYSKVNSLLNNLSVKSFSGTKPKIILLWATIRPEMFKKTHSVWMENSSGNNAIITRVAVDTQKQANELNGYDVIFTNNTVPGVCYPCYCLSSTLKTNTQDIVIYASDDFFPPKNWDEFVIAQFAGKSESVLVVNDGIQKYPNNVITIPIMNYGALKKLNHTIYHPAYTHMHCDVELFDLCNRMGILNDIRNTNPTIFEHRHHVNKKRKLDVHDTNLNSTYATGLEQYNTRKNKSISELISVDNSIIDKVTEIKKVNTIRDLTSKRLSILVCTTDERKHFLDRLMNCLNSQSNDYVEVLIETDNGSMKIGKKRNILLDRAVGDYVCFVDDDDLVSDDYCMKILSATESNPDCCSLEGLYTVNGENPTLFRHSLKYTKWETASENGKTVYYRCPNHLNAIKRSIALQVRFDDNKSNGEDKDFSDRVRPLLQTESIINGVIYHYLYLQVKKGY